MTDPSDRLPDDYQDRIGAIESDLGRSICGFPTEGLEPCQQWPADESGRCSKHKDRDVQEAINELTASGSNSPQSLSPQETLTDTQPLETGRSNGSTSSTYRKLFGSYGYWAGLILVGLLMGAGTAAMTLDLAEDQRRAPREETEPEETFELNFDDPDFNKIRQSYREGNYREVASSLSKLIEETSRDSTRAQALYYSFVFHQNQQNYQRAIEAAEKFLNEYKDHYRRAEVLYGAWFISEQFLEDSERAERYRETLLEEFPDTKWADRLSS